MTGRRQAAHDARAAEADFGFRRVPAGDKKPLVAGVFSSVANRYDLMNDLMSGGVHRLWKAAMIDWLAPRRGMHLLDVAGGTGDIALRFLERVKGRGAETEGGSRVTVCDINPAMLEVGMGRALDRGVVANIDWLVGDAEALPVGDKSADAYTIAFGLRNVTHLDRALAEARRVLKPGGRFLCLEFSRVALPLLGKLYDRYSFAVVPALGGLVAGDRAAYQYLVESIRRFPPQEELAAMIAGAGLGQVKYRNLSGGIAAMHSAWRL
ncbi:MAG: bifunctional demethylmenaquinone methyltransferase/2-methoxy-6-polyprenyl-1,4-benzoquinol methylase UbiE [Alphaproteobacteria bacterium]